MEKLTCLSCGSKDFEVREGETEIDLRGKKIFVFSEAYECKKYKTSLMNSDQMNILRAKVEKINSK